MFFRYATLSAPLYALVLLGYAVARLPRWRLTWTAWASNFVFAVALPALLFHMMSDLSSLPPVDARLLLAFFGGCLIVFVVGRVVAARVFELDGVAQSLFALGGIFSNNVLLGLPLAKLTIGPAAVPVVALVLVFNSLTLWTLVSVSVEWARHGAFTLAGIGKTAQSVAQNPIVASIVGGTLFGLTGAKLPWLIDRPLALLGRVAGPSALIVLGLGLAQYGVRRGWQQSLAICALKLVFLPLVVWGLAALLRLPALETRVIVLLSSMATGANVYLMSIQFKSMQGPVASSLVLSTALAALTTPVLLSLLTQVN
jgi:malonate transporter